MKKMAPLLVILGGIFWGIAGLFVRYLASYGIDSLQISCIRMISAAIIMSVVILIKDKSLFKIDLKDIWIFICGGAFSVFFTGVFYFNTISISSLSVACILMYTAPVFVLIASFFIFGEKFTYKKLVAIILAFSGCVLVSGLLESEEANFSLSALFSGILSGIGYASYSIFGKFSLKKYSPYTYTLYAFIFAGAASLFAADFSLIFSIARENPLLYGFYPFTGFMISVVPYLLYTLGLSEMESGTASVLACVEPLVATLIGVFVFCEPITLLSVIGIAFIMTSMIILR